MTYVISTTQTAQFFESGKGERRGLGVWKMNLGVPKPLALTSFELWKWNLEDLYGSANDPRTANDPGPQMIPKFSQNFH